MPRCLFRLALMAALALLLPVCVDASVEWAEKVDPWVIETLERQGKAEFLVFLQDQADLSAAKGLGSKVEKGRFVFDQLTAAAERSQPAVLAEIAGRRLEHRSYWVATLIWVRGDEAAVAALASRADVERLYANPWVELDGPVAEEAAGARGAVEDSLIHVGAPDLWALGFTGQGAVVAGADTGYDWDHVALKNQYRGWDGGSATHDYNWHDAIHSGGGSCGADLTEPCDDTNHGTHTMGTMVGDDGGSNRIGMAPGARWIGCRNMDRGAGTPTTYSECFQFFIAPTDLNDQNPNPALAPHVVNGSWSCPPSEGCTDPNVLLIVVQNVRAAGIVISQSAGNSGSGCSTITTPAAIYDASFTIGAVNNSDAIAGFSSRGPPVTVDGSNRLKPDVTAPGVSIRSSVPGDGYSVFSGTSMSAPHVSGLVALIVSAAPALAGDPDAIEQHIMDTAVPGVVTGQTCGGIPDSHTPNNTYGYGAIRAVLPAIFADGFESGDTSAWSDSVP
ncbi:MAG: S8 family serine peptidase [Acidobacteria bacterium]|nr:S8 family serine peptidase [Acidobacteriota bacterium]